jgi:hypothetical protein
MEFKGRIPGNNILNSDIQVFLANPNLYIIIDVHPKSITGFHAVIDMSTKTYHAKYHDTFIRGSVVELGYNRVRGDSEDDLEFWFEIKGH